MLLDVSRFVRNEYKALEPSELLTKSVDCLLGVSPLARQAIAKLGIASVFDLACSQTFATASEILAGATGSSTGLARYGQVPGELLDEGQASTKLMDLPFQSIEVLRHIGPSRRTALEEALDVKTIRDFSLWPPYHAARAILSEAYGEARQAEDRESPQDLIPANGQYPTERVQYEVLLFDEYVNELSSDARMVRLPGDHQRFKPLHGPLDVSELLASVEGYDRPAVGGVLTFTQSWYTKGLALGNLIHSVALAPGESTKIAMIDWSRKTSTTATEDIGETEALDSTVARSRGISEITSAVAKETQEGRSAAHSNAQSSQYGEATGSASFLTSLVSLPGVNTSGTSFGTSSGSSDATSWSTSSGQRDVAAKLNQDIVDRTQQASHSARNRRASIVREVSQTESERISTRTLTNYNHMHALTVEYYEVVQLYRTVVELAGADRCLFVPMKLIDFRNVSMIDRYRGVLAAAALVPAVREGLQYPTGTTRIKAPGVTKAMATVPSISGQSSPLDDLSPDSWTAMDILQARVVTGGVAKVQADGRLVLPSDAVAYDIDFVTSDKTTKPETLTLTKLDGTGVSATYQEQGGWDLSDKRLRIDELAAVTMTASGVTGSGKTGFLSIIFQLGSKSFRIVFPVKLEANVAMPVLFAATVPVDLISHFQDNRLYYSQAIWRGLDPATIGILLSGYTWPMAGQERPLVEIVNPRPVAIVANYIVLRLSGDDAVEREAWMSRKKVTVGRAREDLVPVPSGGVFAEAVLGRSNSAEKLDITRFWNWQDSPIPIQAPDIAPIQAGSRATPDNTTPGQLGQPVLNIVNAPSMPDPQGLGAVLGAIQNGNMFRDMSGLAATIGLAQAGLAGAQQGASDASAQAGKNAAVAAELGAKVAEVAGKVVAAYLTGGGALAGGGGGAAGLAGGISGQGAKINHGQDMDRRQSEKGAGGATSAVPPAGGTTASPAGAGSDVADASSALTGTASNEDHAFRTSLGGGGSGIMGIPSMMGSLVQGGLPGGQSSPANPALLMSGARAIQKGAELLSQPNTVDTNFSLGPARLSSGSVWSEGRMLVSVDTVKVVFLQQESLFEMGAAAFLRDHQISVAAAAGASAKPLAEFVNAEVKLLAGILVPFYYLFAVSAAGLGLKYYDNRQLYNNAFSHGERLFKLLQRLRESNPKLFSSLARTAVVDGFLYIPQSFTAEDAAFFVGRVIRGIVSPAATGAQVGLKVVVKSFLTVSLILGTLQLPAASLQALKAEAKAKAADLDARLKQEGVSLDADQLEALLVEGATQPQTRQLIQDIQVEAEELIPLATEMAHLGW